MTLPITLRKSGSKSDELKAETRDVSFRGLYFTTDHALEVGSQIEFVLTLPSEITLADPIRVRCKGKVVRVDKMAREQGVAVAIEKYDFVRDA